jgi:molybdopterin converting factor small subunit
LYTFLQGLHTVGMCFKSASLSFGEKLVIRTSATWNTRSLRAPLSMRGSCDTSCRARDRQRVLLTARESDRSLTGPDPGPEFGTRCFWSWGGTSRGSPHNEVDVVFNDRSQHSRVDNAGSGDFQVRGVSCFRVLCKPLHRVNVRLCAATTTRAPCIDDRLRNTATRAHFPCSCLIHCSMAPSQFTVLYFATAASYTHKASEHFPAPMTVTALFARLEQDYPQITTRVLDSCAVTINLDYVTLDSSEEVVICESDEVALIPPVSSG